MMAGLLLVAAGTAWGEGADLTTNRLTVTDVTIEAGKTAELHVGVVNEMNVAEYGFRLYLPEGVTVEEDEYGYFYELTDRQPKGRGGVDLFQVTILQTDEPGVLMFSAACPTQKILSGNEGDAMIITLRASENATPGTFTGRLGRIDLSNEDGTLVSTPDDVTFEVTILNMDTGIRDVNIEQGGKTYNLKGQRVEVPRKGLTISSGKKTIK